MATDAAVTVYWRPGCGFCSSLIRSLDRFDLQYDRVNIWEDEQGAAFVRSVANGNETVPTVTVGDVALVNPSGNEVLATVADQAPDHLPEGYEPPQPGRLTRAVSRLLGS
jgi:mycoredoxin